MEKTIILIDEPLEIDRRVLEVIKNYDDPIIEDCSGRDGFKLSQIFYNIDILFHAALLAPFYWLKLYKNYGLKSKNLLAGIKASLRIYSTAQRQYIILRDKYKNAEISTIYANDLRCGIIGIYLAKHLNVELIYDAHELEFHRNRAKSILRVVFDIIIEKKVTSAASEVIVVNKPILEAYRNIYKIPQSKISIVNNVFFTPYPGYALENFSKKKDVAITYVGAGIRGRKLDNLTHDTAEIDIKLYGFFLSDVPKIALEPEWIIGSKDYLPELLELVKTSHLAMWACTDDVCLSYRLSLGNKFFQAMAVGIPVIASEGTYLAEITEEYNLGYIYNGSNLEEIICEMKDSESYEKLLQSIVNFQIKLFEEKIVL